MVNKEAREVVGEEEEEKTKGLWEMFLESLQEKKTKDTGKFKKELE